MRFIWIYVLCAMSSLPAAAGNQGYRVRTKLQTLIQIARDIYKDERQWKEIAFWNGLKPPYALNVNQVLVLKAPPVAPIPRENLVTGPEIDSIKPLTKRPSVERQIKKNGNDLIYVVNERAPSLMMIARELYDDASMAQKISSWGGFEPGTRLSLGQHLRLKVPPTKTAAEGTAILIANWRALGNELMVERLGGTTEPNVRQPATAPKKSKKPCEVPCAVTCDGRGRGKSAAVKGGGKSAAGGGGGPGTGGGRSTAGSGPEPKEDRQPTSAGGDTSVLQMKSDSPDGFPSAHKTEHYWLGDDAPQLLQMLEKKLRGH